jgi:hypothetical protein
MERELRTLLDANGTPLLGLVKQGGMLVLYEADDMDRQIELPVSEIAELIKLLDDLKEP